MQLPAITLPQIDLPFAIPAMLHPSVVHFAIALPVFILLLEVYNLFIKRKSIGVFSFILLILTVVLFALAYLTGGVDGKETFDLLSGEGQTLLKEHKLSGTYLLLGSVLILLLKLFAISGNAFFKFIYIMSLGLLVFCTFNQGKEGGELTYTHGANVAKVKALDDALYDANDELEELKAVKVPEVPSTPVIEVEIPTPQTEPMEEKTIPAKEIPAAVLPIIESAQKNINVDNLLNSAKEGMKEASDKVLSSLETTAQEVMEMVPTEIEVPKTETH